VSVFAAFEARGVSIGAVLRGRVHRVKRMHSRVDAQPETAACAGPVACDGLLRLQHPGQYINLEACV